MPLTYEIKKANAHVPSIAVTATEDTIELVLGEDKSARIVQFAADVDWFLGFEPGLTNNAYEIVKGVPFNLRITSNIRVYIRAPDSGVLRGVVVQ